MQTDVLIIGCGMAGAVAALTLAEDKQRQITVITRAKTPIESNTYYAQGGIIGGFTKNDPEELIEDIL
ncbi:MAG: L-aspartate oxidase, partial [Chloroflexota bacterium]